MDKGTLFKILAILIGIFIWKTVMTSFAKARKAIKEDEDADSRAKLDLAEQWRQAAARLSCTFAPGEKPNGKDMSITGSFSGRFITIRRFGQNYVRYFVAFRQPPAFHVCVVRDLESVARRILEGHPIFPSRMFFSSQEPDFYCSAESEEAFDRFLDVPSNRSAVLNLVRLFPAGMFNRDGVSVRLRASEPDPEVIVRMAAVADALENPSQTPMPDLLTAPKKNPVPLPPIPSVPPEPAVETENTPKRFRPLQIEVPPERRRRPESTPAEKVSIVRITSEKATPTPIPRNTPPVFAGNQAMPASEQQPPPVEEHKPAPAPSQSAASSVSPADSALTVEAVCAALFAKSFPGSEERAAFEAMKGRRVRWSGELQMVMPFSMDFVFGSRKGVKATLLICNMTQGQSGIPIRIKAVAAFPPELRTALEAAKGKTVAFEGELLKFEPFAREIYLQDASLVS